jgi:protoporphyrinogen oxidase
MAIPGVIEYSNLHNPGAHIVYVPYYMPKTHTKYRRPDADYFIEVDAYLARINPAFGPDWVLASRVSRYEFAQTVCTPGFFEKLPPMKTSIGGFFMADTSYYYPEDRSISESIRIGNTLATLASK